MEFKKTHANLNQVTISSFFPQKYNIIKERRMF